MLSNCDIFNSPLILPEAKTLVQVVYSCDVFNNVLYAPKATSFSYAIHVAKLFNRPVFFTKAVNCNYLLGSSSSFNSPIYLPKATACSRLLNSTAFNHPLVLPSATDCSYMLRYALAFNNVVDIPKAKNCSYMLDGCSVFNQSVKLPSCTNAQYAFSNTAMSAENIAATLDSLPTWVDGSDHVITFTDCPGQVSTQYLEPFTVTDTDGTEYTLENCPRFDTDDENQTLRKSFVLAILKKGWTIDLSESALAWYEYTLEKATLTGEQKNIDLVNETLADYKADNSDVVAAQLIDNWRALTEYETSVKENGAEDSLTQEFWTEYFRATEEYKADPTAKKDWSLATGDNPYKTNPPTRPIVDFNVTNANGTGWTTPSFSKDTDVPIFLPRLSYVRNLLTNAKINHPVFCGGTNIQFLLWNCLKFNSLVIVPNVVSCSNLLANCKAFNQALNLPKATTCDNLLYYDSTSTGLAFDNVCSMPACSSAKNSFKNCSMSAENISKTLDILPTWADGVEHIITFTGCPGASELNQDSPSVANAIAKGWTVEL